MNNSYHIREASLLDARRIWEIRYHPLINETAIDQTIVLYEQHEKWFGKHYGSRESEDWCFVLVVESEVVGYCRFDKNGDEFIISIALDPSLHGKGLGKFLLEESLKKFGHEELVIAIIKKNNMRSQKLFTGAGFYPIGEKDDCMIFRMNHAT